MSQGEFARALSHGSRGNHYSQAYISQVESGHYPITDELLQSLQRLAADTSHLRILPRGVYATVDLPPGTVILGRPVVCPSCGGVFIMPWASQRYCSRECRNEARRQRRAAKRV